MSALVVYDSDYGNTEKIARTIYGMLEDIMPAKIARAEDVDKHDIDDVDTLIVGSPTQGGRPTQAMQDFINDLDRSSVRRIRVAVFDTRIEAKEQGFGLKTLMKVIGYAAPKMAKSLQSKGGKLSVPPEGFIVKDKEGPLKEGEAERAVSWARGFTA